MESNKSAVKETLRVALAQVDLVPGDKAGNLAHLEELIAEIETPFDLLVLPEMFNTGFSVRAPEVAEAPGLSATRWMQQIAAQYQAVVCGSVAIKEQGAYYNRLLWVRPDGVVQHYNKAHLFSIGGEHEAFTPGREQPVFTWQGWRIRPFICYDLRFPVFLRNRFSAEGQADYDILVGVAHWPIARIGAWDALCAARAAENQAYVVAVNRVGQAGDWLLPGHSGVWGPDGKPAHQVSEEKIDVVELSHSQLLAFRKDWPFWQDADDFLWRP